MSRYGRTLNALVTGMIEAVASDEQLDGIDISSGLIGTRTSEWLRDVAEQVSGEKRPVVTITARTRE